MKRFSASLVSLALLMLGLSALADQAAGPVTLTSESNSYPLGLHIDILNDPDGRLTIEDVMRPAVSKRFTPSRRQSPSFGFDSSVHWIRFALVNRNNPSRDWVLELQSPTIDKINVYYSATGGDFRERTAGDFIPFKKWEIDYSSPAFRLTVPPGERKVCLLRLESSGLIRVPLFLRTFRAFESHARREQMWSGLFFGATAIIVIYGVFLWLALRDNTHLYYVLSIASLTITSAVFTGLAYQYVWPSLPPWNTAALTVFSGITIYSLMGFVRSFVRSKEYAPTLDKAAKAVMYGAILVSVLAYPAHRLSVGSAIAVSTAWCALTPILSVRAYLKGYKPALTFLLAYIVLLVGLLVWTMALAGPGGYSTGLNHLVRLGLVVTWVLVAGVLANRYRLLQSEYSSSLEREVERRTKDLGEALSELRKNRDLMEVRVEERTAELAESNEQLKQEIQERIRTEKLLEEAHFRLEESARECFISEERFRTVFEAARDFMFIKDRVLKYQQANPFMLNLLGESPETIVGKTDDDLFDPEYARFAGRVEERVLKGASIETEHTLTIDEQPFTLNCIRFPMKDRSGRVVGLCGICRDVTERKQIVQEPTSRNQEYHSSAMVDTVGQILLAAQSDGIVLFLGESGSGKDHWARYLHDHSRRAGSPFFSINCAALNSELVESELFGHERGAFTGAHAGKRGLLELAEGGTLLLNEIGEMPLPLQSKLLTFLDTQSFTRLGGEKSITVDSRVLAATNRDLRGAVKEGLFREDLYHRLNVFHVHVPPLRNRTEDIPALAGRLLKQLGERMGFSEVSMPDAQAMEAIQRYEWPGNVRELRNVLERALILTKGSRITIRALSLGETGTRASRPPKEDELSFQLHISPGTSFQDAFQAARRSLIGEALGRCDGNVSAAARLLGMPRGSLRTQMKYLDIT